uniref:Uncharacterized protein n=1 Tax=Nelumbo nucifera TaxID=4432 RepID=A0A822XL18_NELNU|nr:TPA_asm: hypothetical protein HUJ06_022155 [Nelumbo nucifera]
MYGGKYVISKSLSGVGLVVERSSFIALNVYY